MISGAHLERRHAEHFRLKRAGQIVLWVSFRNVAAKRRGPKESRPIHAFDKSWAAACAAAGCPGAVLTLYRPCARTLAESCSKADVDGPARTKMRPAERVAEVVGPPLAGEIEQGKSKVQIDAATAK